MYSIYHLYNMVSSMALSACHFCCCATDLQAEVVGPPAPPPSTSHSMLLHTHMEVGRWVDGRDLNPGFVVSLVEKQWKTMEKPWKNQVNTVNHGKTHWGKLNGFLGHGRVRA